MTSNDQDEDFEAYEPSRSVDAGRPLGRFLMQVLWPAFLGAAAATGVLFSAVDPLHVDIIGIRLDNDRMASYTLGFIIFWVLFSLSGALTYLLVSTQARQDS